MANTDAGVHLVEFAVWLYCTLPHQLLFIVIQRTRGAVLIGDEWLSGVVPERRHMQRPTLLGPLRCSATSAAAVQPRTRLTHIVLQPPHEIFHELPLLPSRRLLGRDKLWELLLRSTFGVLVHHLEARV